MTSLGIQNPHPAAGTNTIVQSGVKGVWEQCCLCSHSPDRKVTTVSQSTFGISGGNELQLACFFVLSPHELPASYTLGCELLSPRS